MTQIMLKNTLYFYQKVDVSPVEAPVSFYIAAL